MVRRMHIIARAPVHRQNKRCRFSSICEHVAVVAGGSGAIGSAIVRKLSIGGAKVVVLSRSGIRTVRDDLAMPSKVSVLRCDFASSDSIRDAFSKISSSYGSMNIFVNSIGLTSDGLLARTSDKEIDDCISVNLRLHLTLYREAIRTMLRCVARETSKSCGEAETSTASPLNQFGVQLRNPIESCFSIVGIGSVVGSIGNVGQVVYSASKAALHGATKSLSREIGSRGITVNLVEPGFIESPMTSGLSGAIRADILARTALGKFGRPEDVANLVAFLCGHEARFITGQILRVDGGLSS